MGQLRQSRITCERHQRAPTVTPQHPTSLATMQSITVRAPVAARPATALRSQVGGACSAGGGRQARQQPLDMRVGRAPGR